ncbi:hypothetical protein M8818_002688 [Zalaria obscura]|uniref:Uncharacterized protein n=1 Tax=Zalaria obscura TaxID=2024903 RepID=A0ACC3SIJ2_9PEZI
MESVKGIDSSRFRSLISRDTTSYPMSCTSRVHPTLQAKRRSRLAPPPPQLHPILVLRPHGHRHGLDPAAPTPLHHPLALHHLDHHLLPQHHDLRPFPRRLGRPLCALSGDLERHGAASDAESVPGHGADGAGDGGQHGCVGVRAGVGRVGYVARLGVVVGGCRGLCRGLLRHVLDHVCSSPLLHLQIGTDAPLENILTRCNSPINDGDIPAPDRRQHRRVRLRKLHPLGRRSPARHDHPRHLFPPPHAPPPPAEGGHRELLPPTRTTGTRRVCHHAARHRAVRHWSCRRADHVGDGDAVALHRCGGHCEGQIPLQHGMVGFHFPVGHCGAEHDTAGQGARFNVLQCFGRGAGVYGGGALACRCCWNSAEELDRRDVLRSMSFRSEAKRCWQGKLRRKEDWETKMNW